MSKKRKKYRSKKDCIFYGPCTNNCYKVTRMHIGKCTGPCKDFVHENDIENQMIDA